MTTMPPWLVDNGVSVCVQRSAFSDPLALSRVMPLNNMTYGHREAGLWPHDPRESRKPLGYSMFERVHNASLFDGTSIAQNHIH